MATGHQSENPKKLSDEQVQLVRNELESVIASDAFTGSKRCQDFLRLVIDHTLAGDLDELRERMIGVEMFHRPADYDTANDAVVGGRATQVRKRLAQYYRETKAAPAVRIDLPPGSYVPEFHWSLPPSIDGVTKKNLPRQAATPMSRRTSILLLIGAILGIGLIAILALRFDSKPSSSNAVRLSLGLPERVNLQRNWHPFEQVGLSPDGQMLAFAATVASGQSSL